MNRIFKVPSDHFLLYVDLLVVGSVPAFFVFNSDKKNFSLRQSLTGKAATDIEAEMGFPSTREGGGLPVEVLRRLAHFLILEASGKLEAPAKEASATLNSTAAVTAAAEGSSKSRKRAAPKMMEVDEPEEQVGVLILWSTKT